MSWNRARCLSYIDSAAAEGTFSDPIIMGRCTPMPTWGGGRRRMRYKTNRRRGKTNRRRAKTNRRRRRHL
jgi:hypothetical protein